MINEKDFKIIFDEYYQRILRYIWLRVVNKDLAQDITQDVFYKIWKKRLFINKNKSIKSYLFKTAYNTLIDFYRKNQVEKKKYEELIEHYKFISEPINISIADLFITLDELPDKLKSPFILSRLEGFSCNEIADILKLSSNTVACYISRAALLMKEKLDEKN